MIKEKKEVSDQGIWNISKGQKVIIALSSGEVIRNALIVNKDKFTVTVAKAELPGDRFDNGKKPDKERTMLIFKHSIDWMAREEA